MLRNCLRRVWLATQRRAVVLLYHRVAEESSDPQMLCTAPRHFAEHLEHIRRHYHPLSLQDLSRALKDRSIPHRAVVITFDDGYADNLLNAVPLLERHDIPATMFITSGYIGENRSFWWDELERRLLLAEHLPEKLVLDINGKAHEWDLPRDGGYGQRYDAYLQIHGLLRCLDNEEQQRVLGVLSELSREARGRSSLCRHLDLEEVNELGANGLIEIGAHTVTHPLLAAQPYELQKKEIVDCKKHIEDILDRAVKSFSYPYGGPADFGREAVSLVRRAGYESACINFSIPLTRWSDRYRMPRCLVRDWDGEEFAVRLGRWFGE